MAGAAPARGALAHADFRRLLVARCASMMGTSLATVAVPFAVLEIGGSASDVGLVLAAYWVPQVLLILLGGVVADRVARRRVMVCADAVSAAAQAASAVLLLTGSMDVLTFAALQLVGGAAFAFFYPASAAIVPQTVPVEDLASATALLRAGVNGASVGGAALGGLLAAVSVGGALAVDAATFLVSVVAVAGISTAATRVVAAAPQLLDELRAGWAEVAGRRWLWVVILQFGVVNMAFDGAFTVLGPVQADRHLGGSAAWGAVVACFGAGLIAGALLNLRLSIARPLRLGVAATMGMAVPPVLLVGPVTLPALAAGGLLAGIGIELFGVQWSLALQRHVPPAALARVSSYDGLGSFAPIPLGMALAGPLSDLAGTTATLLGAAALIVACSLAALAVPEVRDLRAR